jgi:hypothetical protein
LKLYEIYEKVLRGEQIEAMDITKSQRLRIEMFRSFESPSMSTWYIHVKTGICKDIVSQMCQMYKDHVSITNATFLSHNE